MLQNHWNAYFRTLSYLWYEDIIVLKKFVISKIVDAHVWILSGIAIYGYILSYFGVRSDFKTVMFASQITTLALFDAFTFIAPTVGDLTGSKLINYYLTLPVPSWFWVLKSLGSLTLRGMIMSLSIMPLSIIFFFRGQLDLSHPWLWIAFILMVFTNALFCSACVLLITSFIKNNNQTHAAWVRFIYPLWIWGGFQFSWHAVHDIFPTISYVLLFNPMIYTTEGIRSLFLPGDAYIPIWIDIPIMLIFTMGFVVWSCKRFKKRLDWV